MKSIYVKALFIVSSFIVGNTSFSQYYYYNNRFLDNDMIWEFGGTFGGMYSLTDVGKKQYSAFIPGRLDYKSTKLNGGVYGSFTYQNLIGARLEISAGSVSAADSTGSPDRKVRNLSYRSKIKEATLTAEFFPLELTNWKTLPVVAPYVIGGIGWFTFNPQGNYQGTWVDLQPLSTAGQGFAEYPQVKPYRLGAVCIPFGVGFKYDLSAKVAARFEIVERYTLTDYLDDASAPYIDPKYFYEYFPAEKAMLAEAMANRSNKPLLNVVRGGMQTKDKYLTLNFKLGLMLGRERIR